MIEVYVYECLRRVSTYRLKHKDHYLKHATVINEWMLETERLLGRLYGLDGEDPDVADPDIWGSDPPPGTLHGC